MLIVIRNCYLDLNEKLKNRRKIHSTQTQNPPEKFRFHLKKSEGMRKQRKRCNDRVLTQTHVPHEKKNENKQEQNTEMDSYNYIAYL